MRMEEWPYKNYLRTYSFTVFLFEKLIIPENKTLAYNRNNQNSV